MARPRVRDQIAGRPRRKPETPAMLVDGYRQPSSGNPLSNFSRTPDDPGDGGREGHLECARATDERARTPCTATATFSIDIHI